MNSRDREAPSEVEQVVQLLFAQTRDLEPRARW